MYAGVVIEYNVKTLNKTFDYKVPQSMFNRLKVGHKVLVPFGRQVVEGFVLSIHDKKKENLEYKEMIRIIDEDFYLNDELLNLGKFMSEETLSNLISCYQIMLPKALKVSQKTKVNKKYVTYLMINENINLLNYIEDNKRKKKEIEIIEYLLNKKEELKSNIKSSVIPNLIEKKVVLEVKREINREVEFKIEKEINIVLTDDQKNAIDVIINEKTNNKFLLYGVTGSGKTEVYLKLIEKNLEEGKNSIFLVPEISLTPQIISRFKSKFGPLVAILHSKLSDGEKYDEYRKILKGEIKIVVGARSAIFAPLENIGLIIIDECQSSTYKQESTPKYNAIDLAFKRCEYNNAKCITGSATPLLEQYSRALKDVFKLVELNNRINNNIPQISLVDMSNEIKKRNFVLSEKLKIKIKEKLSKNEQVIILLNRRGYSTFISCSSCGYVFKCPNCDISLTYHKSSSNLSCHYCGYRENITKICPHCNEEAIKDLGIGTEKLESILNHEFPESKILRMDVDSTRTKGSHQKLIDSFKDHKYDILVGTQMISKGLNFPDVSLVGIINIDASLNIPDFRSSERTFELLMQTGGRSARYSLPGEVLVQTFNMDNYVLNIIKKYDYKPFYNCEMEIRKKLKYPPYYYLTVIKITSEDYEEAKNESLKIKDYLFKNLSDSFIILGPSTARVFKLKNKYNFQIIIKYKILENLKDVLQQIRMNSYNKKINIDIDFNPINLI